MTHGHSHGDHDHHAHQPSSFGRAFLIGIILNSGFIIIEAAYGILAHSMALLADAGHNLSDVLGLVIAWVAAILADRRPSPKYTFGLKSSTIMAALFNAILLLVAVGGIAWGAINRLFAPEEVAGQTVMIVAAIGIAVNGFTAWLFAGDGNDLNIKGVYLHMAADAAVSAGVVLVGLAMIYTDWLWLDPLVSLVIVAVIIWGTWGLFTESLALSLKAVPSKVDYRAVRQYLLELPGVNSLHDLHIWGMSTTDVAMTVHLVMPGGYPEDAFLMQIGDMMASRFGIGHFSVQIETNPLTHCAMAPDDIV
jgi:cobalt-zinc-cadmium efflux system protein